VRREYSTSPYLCDSFISGITTYVNTAQDHAQTGVEIVLQDYYF